MLAVITSSHDCLRLFRQNNRLQIFTSFKPAAVNCRHRCRQENCAIFRSGQSTIADLFHGIRNMNDTFPLHRCLDQTRFCLVQKQSPACGIRRISGLYLKRRGRFFKRIMFDFFCIFRNDNFSQPAAARKCVTGYPLQARRKHDIFQPFTSIKCRTVNRPDFAHPVYFFQFETFVKCLIRDGIHFGRQAHTFKTLAGIKCAISQTLDGLRNRYFRKRFTTPEGIAVNLFHRSRNADRVQCHASIEDPFA